MAASPAFLQLVSGAIAGEIRTYFPDTALYRRLCWGGFDNSHAYLHREFSPEADAVPCNEATRPAAEITETSAEKKSARSRFSTSLPVYSSMKRRRTSIVEELEKGVQSMDAVLSGSSNGSGVHSAQSHVTLDATFTAIGAESGSTLTRRAPFAVTCEGCTTRVLSMYPCYVMKGYVVLWAESVLQVRCTPKKCAIAAAAPTAAAATFLSFSPPIGGLRPPLHQRNTNAGAAAKRLLPASLTAFADALLNADASQVGRADRTNESRSLASCGLTSGTTTQQLTLYSLHIVNDDAVTRVRPASFAIQSVLQPGVQTALECYPRHMVHFGLLCYAAWRASSQTWRELMASRTQTADDGKGTKKMSEDGREHAMMALLPHAAEDAVLILGLGGNVLGQCLDAILPSAVPLHVVELEPAVLRACEEHHQFPACVQSNSESSENKPDTTSERSKTTTTRVAPRKRTKRSPFAGPAGVWQEVAELLEHNNGTSPVFSAVRCGADTKSEYLCFLQDAYVFLRTTPSRNSASKTPPHKTTPTVAKSDSCLSKPAKEKSPAQVRSSSSRSSSPAAKDVLRSTRENTPTADQLTPSTALSCVPAVASLDPVQYSMIFLDCYDPDREHMMHEGGLIDLCARRLRPGGVLLVNAHVLPTAANLERDFLTRGFATVQALRVSGCTQTVLACVVPDEKAPIAEHRLHVREEKCNRFTVHQLQVLARGLNASGSGTFSTSKELNRDACSSALLRAGFQLDASWLKTSRRVVFSPKADSNNKGQRRRRAVSTTAGKRQNEVDFRVWQHYF